MLTNRYRPKIYSDILGQHHITKALKAAVKYQELLPGYIFSGKYGSGKTTIARVYGRSILCEAPVDGEACNICSQCLRHIEGTNLNSVEIDAASHGGVDDVRELVRLAQTAAVGSDHRVILIDECHRLSPQGWDAFLKELEEGTTNTVFLFCTTEPEKVRDAVKSRCGCFTLSPIKLKDIISLLVNICNTENLTFEPAAIHLIVLHTKGHVRDAINYIDQLSRLGGITEQSVKRYLNIDLIDKCIYLLKILPEDVKQAYSTLEECITFSNPDIIAKTIGKVLLDSYKLSEGVVSEYDSIPQSDALYLKSIYKHRLLKTAEKFMSVQMDFDLLVCNILSIMDIREESLQRPNKNHLQRITPTDISSIVVETLSQIVSDKVCNKHSMMQVFADAVEEHKKFISPVYTAVQSPENLSESEMRRLMGRKQYRVSPGQATMFSHEPVSETVAVPETSVKHKVIRLITQGDKDTAYWVHLKNIINPFGGVYIGEDTQKYPCNVQVCEGE